MKVALLTDTHYGFKKGRKKFHSKKIVRREYFSYGGNVMI